jgi:F-type H+-transporting ATPase subunit a
MFNMRIFAVFSALLLAGWCPLVSSEAEGLAHEAAAEAAHSGIPVVAPVLFEIPILGGLPVTNTMAMSWVVSLVLILGLRLAVGRCSLVPGKAQAVVETLVSTMRDLVEMIVGPKMLPKVFPLLICLFLFILTQNWCGLFPGIGAVGSAGEHGELVPFLRPANSDLNMAFALTLIHFVAWLYFVLRYAGPKTLFLDLFGNRRPRTRCLPMYLAMFVVFAAVGLIEVVSLCSATCVAAAATFRQHLRRRQPERAHDGLAAGCPDPLLLHGGARGRSSGVVFTILVSVYIGQICNHSEEEHGH